MNFVDTLLENIDTIPVHEIIDTALDKWGSTRHGINEETSLKYPQFINDLLHIADMDTSANFEGFLSFVCYCDILGFKNTIKAFRNIKADKDADILEEIFNLPEVQNLYTPQRKRLSDQTAERIMILSTELYFNQPDTNMWDFLEIYLEKEIHNYTMHTRNRLKN